MPAYLNASLPQQFEEPAPRSREQLNQNASCPRESQPIVALPQKRCPIFFGLTRVEI